MAALKFQVRISLVLIMCAIFYASAQAEEIQPVNRMFVVGFAQDTLANDWRVAQVKEVAEVLAGYSNIKLIVKDAKGDPAVQAMHIESFAEQGVDVIITSPMSAAYLTPVIDSVYHKGTPVILLDRGVNGSAYTTFIRPDNRPIAEKAAELIAKKLKGNGRILMLTGLPGATPTIQRTDGFMKYVSEYPNLKVISKVANYLRSDALCKAGELLDKGVKFDAIYAQSDSMAVGARMALKRHGLKPEDFIIVGIDYIKEAQEAIRNSEQYASFTYPTGGTQGALLAVRLIKGEKVPKDIIVDSVMVTRENVKSVRPIF